MNGPIIVTATFGNGDNGWIQSLRQMHYPRELNRVPAHLTLFRQLPPSLERELGQRLAAHARAAAPQAWIGGVMDLGEGSALTVRSEELEDIREDLASALHGLLMPQDQTAWHPHVTVQNKVEPKEARKLQQAMRGRYEGRPLAIKGLAMWRYLDGPWEAVRDYPFRGRQAR
jgi:hypothetical protein